MSRSFEAWQREIFALYGQQQYRRALEVMAAPPPGLTEVQEDTAEFWAACLHVRLEENELALSALERVHERGGWLAPLRLEHDADLAPIRGQPRFLALLEAWRQRQRHEQAGTRPQLIVLNPVGKEVNTLVALHMNLGSAGQTSPLLSDLPRAGWRVALAQSGQVSGPETFIWNDSQQADQETQAWAAKLGGQPIWVGFSAGAQVALRNALTGVVPASGVLAVIPSVPAEPAWWPATLPGVPVAFILGERDHLTPHAQGLVTRLQSAGQSVRVWMHPGGHELPSQWSELRDEALHWLSQYSHPTGRSG